MRHRNILLLLLIFISNCQYFSAEQHQDSATLTRVIDTKYQQHIKAINDCLESAQEQLLSNEEKQAIAGQLKEEEKQRDGVETIKPAHYGSICANYSSGTIESERVRRCRYQLDMYPAAAISHCIAQARLLTTQIKTTLVAQCKKFQAEAKQVNDAETKASLMRNPLYEKIKNNNCDDEG